jgi:actin-like ATPase involved in cell morphogenesis
MLRFNKIISFKDSLKKKINATYEKSVRDPNYTTFLKHFGEYKVAHLTEKEVSTEKYIVSAIDELRHEMIQLRRSNKISANTNFTSEKTKINILTNYIEKFKEDNEIEQNIDIILLDKEEELLKYLEKSTEIRRLFENRIELKNFMNSMLTF